MLDSLYIQTKIANWQKISISLPAIVVAYCWQSTNTMPAIAASSLDRVGTIDLEQKSPDRVTSTARRKSEVRSQKSEVNKIELSSHSLMGALFPPPPTRSKRRLIAGADNFNPALNVPPIPAYIPIPPPPAPPAPPAPPSPPSQTAPLSGTNAAENSNKESSGGKPFAVLEEVQPNVYTTWNNSGQVHRIVEPTAILKLNNGDRLSIITGYDTYEQAETKTAVNIPLGINWDTKINSLSVGAGAGVDIANGSTTPNFNLKVSYPITSSFTVGADLAQGAYKFNAKTIENQVTALRYGPSVVWQIDKDTSLFSSLHLGSYNDNNQETQLLSRIERKFGEFSVAGSMFLWNYQNPTDKGYFTPPDFLVYGGEFAWEGNVFTNNLTCRVAVSLGEQRVNAKNSDAGGYQTKCTAKLSPNIDASLGYTFSNVKDRDSGSAPANSQSLAGQVKVKF